MKSSFCANVPLSTLWLNTCQTFNFIFIPQIFYYFFTLAFNVIDRMHKQLKLEMVSQHLQRVTKTQQTLPQMALFDLRRVAQNQGTHPLQQIRPFCLNLTKPDLYKKMDMLLSLLRAVVKGKAAVLDQKVNA